MINELATKVFVEGDPVALFCFFGVFSLVLYVAAAIIGGKE